MNNTDEGQSFADKKTLENLRSLLNQHGVDYEILDHSISLHTAEDGPKVGIGTMEESTPTLILKTNLGYMAAIIRGSSRLSYKKIKKELGLKSVCLASPEEVLKITGSPVGSVSLIQTQLQTIIDLRVLQIVRCYGGTGVPHHTLHIDTRSLVNMTHAKCFDLSESK